jgi:VWFA-related protein
MAMKARAGVVLGVLAPLVVCLTIAAQGQKPLVFRTATNIVQTDVTVLGPDGRPWRGLTAQDFELFEDGEPLPILGFAEVDLPDASDAPPWMRETSPDVRSALDGRVFLFLLDDGQVPYLMGLGRAFIRPEKRLEGVRRIVDQFLNRMGPDDVSAVICVYSQRCDQDFTADRTRVRAAVEEFRPVSVPPDSKYGDPKKASAGMAASIAKYLQGHTGRRRSIIYITPLMPIRPAVWPPSGWAGNVRDLSILAAFEHALRAGVTVFAVNPNSLVSLADAPPDDPDAAESDRGIQFSAPPRSLALETGGFNISRPDQFAEGVTQIIRETGSYYLLGYEPPPRKNTGYNMIGGLRSLEIKVRRPGAVVKARRGYITAPEAKPPKNPPAASTAALSGVLPRTDLALRVHAAPFAVPGKGEALVAVTVGVTQPPVATRTLDRLDVQVRAFTANGDERARSRYQADAWLSRTQDDAASVDIVTELRLKPGTYALRVGSTSERLGTSGSVYADVVVPDFASAPLSLSGILVFSAPQLDHVLPEPLSALLPAIPTTRRDLTGRVLVRAYGRVYQGLRAPLESVEITTTILDGGNAIVLERTESIAPAGFATDRAADLRIDVPVAEFAAGLYRLRVVARAGQNTVTRDVVFRVR